jgi:hypothetical protein
MEVRFRVSSSWVIFASSGRSPMRLRVAASWSIATSRQPSFVSSSMQWPTRAATSGSLDVVAAIAAVNEAIASLS